MKKLFLFLTAFLGTLGFGATTNASFTDVNSSNPYYEAIRNLEQQGIIEGYEDGTYKPNDFISRVETLKIILKGAHIMVDESQTKSSFSDAEEGSWYIPYVNKAKELGIMNGDADTGLLRPADQTNLAENLKMLLEATHRNVIETNRTSYLDVPSNAWFAPYFAYAKSLSLFPQSGGENIQPGLPITRGMMAELMYELSIKPEGFQEGEASYYGLNLHGNGTASGEVFDAYALTAAHPTLPFGTMVKVKNLDNGKEIVVKINDRGPYAEGRIIDLSQAAFEMIAPLSQGVVHVSLVPVEEELKQNGNNTSCTDKNNLNYLSKNTFNGIALDQELPNRFLANEVWTLSGTLSNDEKQVSALIIDSNKQQHIFYAEADEAGKFKINLFFPRAGNYQLGLIPGSSGKSAVQQIIVLSSDCQNSQVDPNQKPLSNLQVTLNQGDLELKWNDSEDYEIQKITFTQGQKRKDYLVYKANEFIPHYADFENWQQGPVDVEIQGAHINSSSVLKSDALVWSPGIKQSFIATKHSPYLIDKKEVTLIDLPQTLLANQALTIKMNPLVNINEKALIVTPSGAVESILLLSDSHTPLVNDYGVRIFPKTAGELQIKYTPTENKVYFFEVNDEAGQASVNIPIYPEKVFPLLPNPIDLETVNDFELTDNLTLLRTYMLNLTNMDRSNQGVPTLHLNSALNALAQMKADDMVKRGYLSHWNPEGLTVNQLRKDFDIVPYVSENIALDSSPELAEFGLMSSAAHRINILKTEWKQAGFGLAKNPEGGYIFVQIFSDEPVTQANLSELKEQVLMTINKVRTTPLTEKENLNTVSQNWSQDMVSKDFFSLTAPNNTKLVDNIHEAGVKEALGTYLVGNSSFEGALDQIAENTQLKDSRWKNIGIGIAQDEFGIIKITLSYSE